MSAVETQIVVVDKENLARIMEVWQRCFGKPWSPKEYKKMFHTHELFGYSLELVEKPLACFSRSKTRRKIETVGYVFYYRRGEDTFELWNMAVNPGCQRQGFGTALLEDLKEKMVRSKRRKKICVSIHEANVEVQLFFRSCGFFAEETIHTQCNDPKSGSLKPVDVYTMVYRKPFVPRNRLSFKGLTNASDI